VIQLIISQLTDFLGDGKLRSLDELGECVKIVAIGAVLDIIFRLGSLDVHQFLNYSLVTGVLFICEPDRIHDASVYNVDEAYNADCKKNVDDFFHIGCFY
jgi:hypothetical protein